MEFQGGGIRTISYDGVEIVRGIYAAVRDPNWGTVEPAISDIAMKEFDDMVRLSFLCEHKQGDIQFAWQGNIQLSPHGLQFEFDGTAKSTFLKNRIGFCVLHPMELAGLPLEVETTNQTLQGRFPLAISPHQPYKNIEKLTYAPKPYLQVDMRFEGDLFEMEDQRNWTDASFKTYCTPLEWPFPVEMKAGDSIYQSITVQVNHLKQTDHITGERRKDESGIVPLVVTSRVIRNMPDLGVMIDAPAMLTGDGRSVAATEKTRLSLTPSYLRALISLSRNDWYDQLAYVQKRVSGLNAECGIEIELLYDEPSQLEAFAAYIGSEAMKVRRIIPFCNGAMISAESSLLELKAALSSRQYPSLNRIAIGGGTRAYYAEHNRAEMPLQWMDFTVYSINPQVHAFDDRSLMETLHAQPVTVKDAIKKCGKDLYLGPVTLLPRINPNATDGGSELAIHQQMDERQHTSFGAAWTIGSIASLCQEDLSLLKGICYYNLSGEIGLEDHPDTDLFKAMQTLMLYPNAEVVEVKGVSQRVAALGIKPNETTTLVFAANLTNERVNMEIRTANNDRNPVATTLEPYQFLTFYFQPS
ncbi:hypothetical protein [Paenibacillus sp. PAMC21692]|uniref:hypothetical protein n=1 Tax=Paenibacillus sp. PAMC21692 TaxID=2762320 RepID=UPI00164D0CD9|nr:hypothetical protein [Paenibacillus sp. PAMC21692]QNK57030.1 hypothetical protein H7F31_31810 [Paenibacillus sp. PAMC21692]